MYNSKGEIVTSWFGGGQDLTPYYFFKEDVIHFHKNCKKVCERIRGLECQVFITSTDTSDLNNMIVEVLSPKMFHVKHGEVSTLNPHDGDNE